MKIALAKIPFLAYSLSLEKFRWKIFRSGFNDKVRFRNDSCGLSLVKNLNCHHFENFTKAQALWDDLRLGRNEILSMTRRVRLSLDFQAITSRIFTPVKNIPV